MVHNRYIGGNLYVQRTISGSIATKQQFSLSMGANTNQTITNTSDPNLTRIIQIQKVTSSNLTTIPSYAFGSPELSGHSSYDTFVGNGVLAHFHLNLIQENFSILVMIFYLCIHQVL
jgi:hypothetical protein